MKNKTATGVEFIWKGEKVQILATKEVIVSAGAINTPKLLMLSGVGPKDHLKELEVICLLSIIRIIIISSLTVFAYMGPLLVCP